MLVCAELISVELTKHRHYGGTLNTRNIKHKGIKNDKQQTKIIKD